MLARKDTKAYVGLALLVMSLGLLSNGCAVIGDIFKAGFVVAILVVLAGVGLVAGVIAIFKRS